MADENKKDTRGCPAKEMECLTRQEVEAYRSMFLEPGEVGARKRDIRPARTGGQAEDVGAPP